ncbi:hypothetical protein Q1695_012912 [Nippostrongylus brasiliensis]|nr:hypothetical protein Q1695_012912 [Nippostrongylus brasiliensis]
MKDSIALTGRELKPSTINIEHLEPMLMNQYGGDRRVPFDCEEANHEFYEEFAPQEAMTRSDVGRVFERQDSLAQAAVLQEFDRARDTEGMISFLETPMNIEDYLRDIRELTGIPEDEVDFDDVELQKCQILFDGGRGDYDTAYDPFAHSEELVQEKSVTTDGYVSESASGRTTVEMADVKTEPEWESNTELPSTSTRPQRKGGRKVQEDETYVPTTTARKYRLKSAQERNNLSYKVKRQRNNDAVRKSRSKAKQLQMMKEKQLEDALVENKNLKEKLRLANERIANCRCRK